jgi:hypothetical protein
MLVNLDRLLLLLYKWERCSRACELGMQKGFADGGMLQDGLTRFEPSHSFVLRAILFLLSNLKVKTRYRGLTSTTGLGICSPWTV